MVALPVRDAAGNALVGFRFAAESELAALDQRVPLALSLVVVVLSDRVLMVFDRWRRQWELPGGMLDPGESARQAAVRELAEETGILATDLNFLAIAQFDLKRPGRQEYGAIYQTVLPGPPQLVVNDEVSDFRWWHPGSPPGDGISPVDAEIGRRAGLMSFPQTPPSPRGGTYSA
ncbi:MAG TPA: NUDIX hydrolase [Pseudonocardiaceae bacterium]|jgi:8-oxo-dGTP pyrophosphatase MutT (NUDIX family)|nr:NUDIX hydrolase [Pseudonocardiaceae bacterium]